MNSRVNKLILLGLTILFFQNCHSQTFKLEDVWTVSDFQFADISAMDEEIAEEWIGKKAIIKEQLYFEYQKINSYKDVFKDNGYCNFRPDQKRDTVLTDSYLSEYKITADQLGIEKNEIMIIRTNCTGTPFHDIMVKTNDEIIVVWDGTFFTLTREK